MGFVFKEEDGIQFCCLFGGVVVVNRKEDSEGRYDQRGRRQEKIKEQVESVLIKG